jgi:2-(3-amino-3-carboxypropyl)histidine synthase
MKTLFIKAKQNLDIIPVLKQVKIQGKVGLVSTIQLEHHLEKAQKCIKDSVIGGQILGCNASKALQINEKVDSFLYIGSGKFHPIWVALTTKKPVYIANPYTNKFYKLPEEEITNYENKKKANLKKFYNATKIGILISTKQGQFHPQQYLELKEKLKIVDKLKNKFKDKECYTFICDNIDEKELENFPDIEAWVNTACPRIEYKNIINMAHIL